MFPRITHLRIVHMGRYIRREGELVEALSLVGMIGEQVVWEVPLAISIETWNTMSEEERRAILERYVEPWLAHELARYGEAEVK